ncbi:uncharacterized protein LOC136037034 isoform X2 [Artemia franciscana]|uniref:Uncharacterized protein n=1 Tax=Artemia franciscana TaxID=6661 RepID=A0AA88L5Z7_ARTSF|nr:hypothetical protein QYM36_005318 [Artemia franciscana]
MNHSLLLKVIFTILSASSFMIIVFTAISSDFSSKELKILLSSNITCDGSRDSDNIISFSLFGDWKDSKWKSRFFRPMKKNILLAKRFYPGWEVRIYYHPNIQHVVAGLSNVRLCNVMALPFAGTDLPASHIDLSWINPRVWRFLPLLDDYVSVFLSRDSDSIILKREVSAVEEWLNFNRSFHVMRDHPQHGAAILAGMWGARLDKRRKEIREAAVDMVLSSQDDLKSTDQRQLEYRIWPIAKSDSVVHDSYFCKNHRLRSRDITLPFPTRRENYTFVGNVVNMSEYLFEECPEECRPVEHKEWYFC